MRALSLTSCLWPGLVDTWYRGRWGGVFMAVGFAALLNLGLITSFLWPELLDAASGRLVWSLIGLFWCFGLWQNVRRRFQRLHEAPGEEDLFLRAQGEYLKGHWLEVESLIQQHLDSRPEDADARLLLATMYRHTRRLDEAARELDAVQCLPGGQRWQFEVARERQRLSRLAESAADRDDEGEATGEATQPQGGEDMAQAA